MNDSITTLPEKTGTMRWRCRGPHPAKMVLIMVVLSIVLVFSTNYLLKSEAQSPYDMRDLTEFQPYEEIFVEGEFSGARDVDMLEQDFPENDYHENDPEEKSLSDPDVPNVDPPPPTGDKYPYEQTMSIKYLETPNGFVPTPKIDSQENSPEQNLVTGLYNSDFNVLPPPHADQENNQDQENLFHPSVTPSLESSESVEYVDDITRSIKPATDELVKNEDAKVQFLTSQNDVSRDVPEKISKDAREHTELSPVTSSELKKAFNEDSSSPDASIHTENEVGPPNDEHHQPEEQKIKSAEIYEHTTSATSKTLSKEKNISKKDKIRSEYDKLESKARSQITMSSEKEVRIESNKKSKDSRNEKYDTRNQPEDDIKSQHSSHKRNKNRKNEDLTVSTAVKTDETNDASKDDRKESSVDVTQLPTNSIKNDDEGSYDESSRKSQVSATKTEKTEESASPENDVNSAPISRIQNDEARSKHSEDEEKRFNKNKKSRNYNSRQRKSRKQHSRYRKEKKMHK